MDASEVPSQPTTAACPSCRTELELDESESHGLQFTCPVCGARVNLNDPATVEVPLAVSRYCIEEFKKITDSDESYAGRWNWFAFFFGGYWALAKGLWKNVLLSFLLITVLSVICYPVGMLAATGYVTNLARRGNYLYYNRLVNRKQLVF